MSDQIPTVIYSYEPRLIHYDRARGTHKRLKHYSTDAGWLCLLEMVRRTGLNINSIKSRMVSLPPGEPDFFNTERRPGGANQTLEWKRMSGSPRHNNLDKIKIGTWEAKQCARQL